MKDIRQELKERGITQLSIANMLRVKASSVHNVITGKRRTPRIRQAIAFALGRPVVEIWPDHREKKKCQPPGRTTGSMLGGTEPS